MSHGKTPVFLSTKVRDTQQILCSTDYYKGGYPKCLSFCQPNQITNATHNLELSVFILNTYLNLFPLTSIPVTSHTNKLITICSFLLTIKVAILAVLFNGYFGNKYYI